MRWIGEILARWTPGFIAARACREVSGDFTALVSERLERVDGGAAAFREAARETGRRAGRRLKERLRLSGSFEDAQLAWRLASKASGMKFTVKRGEGESLFEHTSCPVFDAGGNRLCEDFCLPFVEGLTEAVSPGCTVKVARAAEGTRPCAKALVRR